jgi:hypothetical protein
MPLLPSVTQESIRLWAYDPDLYFKSFGEDALLQHIEWIPLLIELAADTACPRQKHVERLIEGFMQQAFLRHESENLAAFQKILEEKRSQLTTQWLILLMVTFSYIYGIYQQPQRITEAASDKIAKELLQGSLPEPSFTKEAPLGDGTNVYATALEGLKQYLYISPYTGEWKSSKYLRWKTFNDASTL